jgi:hypothetical protein
MYAIEDFMNGDIDELLEVLRIADQTSKLEAGLE